jgi:DNA-binding response OmpR family regulator
LLIVAGTAVIAAGIFGIGSVINRLRQKIDKDFSPLLLHTARGVGYVMCVND